MPVWNHGAEPVSSLQIGDHIAKFKVVLLLNCNSGWQVVIV